MDQIIRLRIERNLFVVGTFIQRADGCRETRGTAGCTSEIRIAANANRTKYEISIIKKPCRCSTVTSVAGALQSRRYTTAVSPIDGQGGKWNRVRHLGSACRHEKVFTWLMERCRVPLHIDLLRDLLGIVDYNGWDRIHSAGTTEILWSEPNSDQ